MLTPRKIADFDPEADGAAEAESGSDEDEDVAGTEHYVSVGYDHFRQITILATCESKPMYNRKSKLRQKDAPALGPKYTGVRVSRAALDDSSEGEEDEDEDEDEDGSDEEDDSEEYDDPDTADLERDNIIDDEEIDSDEAFGEGEEEMFKNKGFTFRDSKSNKSASKATTKGRSKRAVAADFMSSSEGEDDDDDDEERGSDSDNGSDEDDDGAQLDESDSEDGLSDEDDEDSDEGSDEEESDEDEEMEDRDTGDGRSDLRNLMKEGQKSVVATISQAAKADAEKGVAVRQQRRAYDSLLNLRIRLQKGLVATNSVGEADGADDSADKQPYEAAEEAAMKLWNAIDGFRVSLLPEQKAGQKRKREFDANSSTDDIWEDMQATEELAAAKRKKVLDKWSNRVKSTTATVAKERHLSTAGSQSLIAVLESQLVNSDRLVKRTHVPRSCAPLQAAKKVAEDTSIYDDADFYQLLLKELVDQRTNDAGAGSNGNGNVPTVRWTAIKEAKTRKQVDRRASKGRKLRFTVHEKLQNFMAPEDRRLWEEEAIDRLFGTLFGQRMQLKEEVSDDDEDDEMAAAEEGLKLFRS